MCRPLYKPEYCADAIEYIGSGHSIESWAGKIGIHRDTVYNWKDQHPDFADAMVIAKTKTIGFYEDLLLKIAQSGNASAAIFLAKNRAGMRDDFGVDHTSGGEKLPVPILQYVPINDRNKENNGNEKPA